MKTIRTVRRTIEAEEDLRVAPAFSPGDRVHICYGEYEGHVITIRDTRYNHDYGRFEYTYDVVFRSWLPEDMLRLI
jgi:hypothetical protein